MSKVTDEEILIMAESKALKNGWDRDNFYNKKKDHSETAKIFDHDFARAFFGDKVIEKEMEQWSNMWHSWEYHLQIMVLKENPIKYLEKFL